MFVQFACKYLRIEGLSIYNLQFTMYKVRCTIGDVDEAMDGVTELRKAPLR